LAGAVALFPMMAYHRLKARTSESFNRRREEGLFIWLTLRPIALLSMIGFVTYLIDPKWMEWSSMHLPAWARWCGAGLGVVTGLFLFWTMRTLGKNLTDTVVTRAEHTLVTSGPYRWVRHPFYVAVGLAIASNVIVSANWYLLATGGAIFVLLVIRMPREEAKLEARFGEAYRAYRARTGAFFPRL
jgi:protein-S-isoprenylcysteine O-methyltransferase Ste14